MPRFLSKISNLLAAAGIAAFAQSANATVWNIDTVLDGTGVQGFGASLFHDASSSTAQGGTVLAPIPNGPAISGTFNDVTGVFNAAFNLAGTSSFTLMGNLIFGGGGFGNLDNASTLAADFSGGVIAGLSDTTLGFNPGQFCCGGPTGPNTFISDGASGGIITLWGADGFKVNTDGSPDLYYGNFQYNQDPSDIGLDLRIQLTPVPIPAALPLFGTGLGILGFLGWRRRRKAAEVV